MLAEMFVFGVSASGFKTSIWIYMSQIYPYEPAKYLILAYGPNFN